MKKFLAVSLLLLAFAVRASADVDIQVKNKKGSAVIRTEVNLGAENAYKLVSTSMTNARRTPVYIDAGITDAEGNIVFEYENTGVSGTYKIYVDSADLDLKREFLLEDFKGMDYYSPMFERINTAADSGALEELRVASEALFEDVGYDLNEYNSLKDNQAVYKLFANDKKGEVYSDIEAIEKNFAISCTLAKIAENDDGEALWNLYLADKTDKSIGFSLPKSSGNTVADELKESIRIKTFSEAAKAEYLSRADASDALERCCLIVPIREAEHYEDVKKVIEAYVNGGRLSADIKDKNAVSVYKKMMGKSYESFSEIESDFADILKDLKKTASKPSSGGGGGGSSGNKNSSKGILRINPTENNNSGDTETKTSTGNTPKMTFSDMEDAKWALDAVESLYEKGIISGVGDGKFDPHRYVSRAEFAKMAVKLASYTSDRSYSFNDVREGAWYSDFVNAACANGIFVGGEDGSFKPDDHITREQLAIVVYRMIKEKADFPDVQSGGFEDDFQIDECFKGAVYSLKAIGVISGRSNKLYCPNESVTRVEAAVILSNISKYF